MLQKKVHNYGSEKDIMEINEEKLLDVLKYVVLTSCLWKVMYKDITCSEWNLSEALRKVNKH